MAQHSSVSVKWCGAASAVTGSPRALAARTMSTAPAVDTWRKCTRAPVSSARITSRATITVLGRGRATGDAEPARPRTLVHRAAPGQGGILGVLRDHRARQRLRVLERVAHHAGVGDARAVVGEDAHAEVVELAHRRQRLAGAVPR